MWNSSVAIVLLILGGMGANMIWGHLRVRPPTATDMSSQSRTAPPK